MGAFAPNYAGYRWGALAVVEQAKPKEIINRQLQRLNPNLFVEKQLTLDGEQVWCVCLDNGTYGIAVVFEWREDSNDPNSPPVPHLSERVVEEMRRRYQRGPVTTKSIQEANEAARVAREREFRAQLEDLVEQHHRLSGPVHPCLHRGVSLRMSRDKRRSNGEKV